MANSAWGYGVPMISVVGDSFCVPYTMEITVKKRIQGFSKAHYDVFDSSGNLLLQIDGSVWKISKKRVMRDPTGIPLLTLKQTICNFGQSAKWRKVWTVHPGENSDDILFRVEERSPVQLKTRLDVFLPDNDNKKAGDFYVTGSFASLSFKAYKDKSPIAQVHHSYSWGSFCKGRESFKVRVQPEVDYSFIMALLVILEENEN
ncbi:protein LURP-one-related 14-like isoform X1 [Pistacia vera]|uniref:protein LURP-one-related 14-like isoform X1 n=1 Tax=Pistacia vera TaxID=55513 RepID=UPI001263472E|nr:protein LURP-one-related 14-like isoform X1 [Pistacia vera]